MKFIKLSILSIFLTLTASAAVINRAEFINYRYNTTTGFIVFTLVATPLSWVSFYTCENAKDIGSFENSTYLGGWYILDITEEVWLSPNNIGFLWMNSSSAPVYK